MKNIRITIIVLASMCVTAVFMAGNAYASESLGIPMYDEAAYTQKVENSMNKMHGLYLRANDKGLSRKDAAKAKKEYFKIAQGLVRSMHDRIMKLDIKNGAALSHTEVLLNNHITMMTLDMLASEQLAK